MGRVSQKYEERIKKSYSEFRKSGLGKWAAVYYKGIFRNQYSDPKLIYDIFTKNIIGEIKKGSITIVDFGGGDGVLLNIIKQQLSKKNINTRAINLDTNEKSLKLCKNKYPWIESKKHNITKKYKTSFADLALSRFVLQYINKKERPNFFKSMYLTLKKGGLLIILWPGNDYTKEFNRFTSQITGLISKKSPKEMLKSHWYPSFNEAKKNIKNAGFNKIEKVKLKAILFTSASSWKDRFKINKNDFLKIERIYKYFFIRYPYLFKKLNKKIYITSNLFVIKAKK